MSAGKNSNFELMIGNSTTNNSKVALVNPNACLFEDEGGQSTGSSSTEDNKLVHKSHFSNFTKEN
jgi:hypothetical protein